MISLLQRINWARARFRKLKPIDKELTMTDTKILENWKVWLIGLLSFAPLMALPLSVMLAALAGPELGYAMIGPLFYGLLPAMTLIFILRIWRRPRLDTSTKVFWSLGLFVLSPFAVPYYWYTFHWKPYRSRKLYADI